MKFKLIIESEENKKSYKLYTNGIKTIRVYDGETPPEGYYQGQHHSHTPWNKGLDRKTSDKVNSYITKGVETRKSNNSYIPWNKGLTKEDDDRIKGLSGEKKIQCIINILKLGIKD